MTGAGRNAAASGWAWVEEDYSDLRPQLISVRGSERRAADELATRG